MHTLPNYEHKQYHLDWHLLECIHSFVLMMLTLLLAVTPGILCPATVIGKIHELIVTTILHTTLDIYMYVYENSLFIIHKNLKLKIVWCINTDNQYIHNMQTSNICRFRLHIPHWYCAGRASVIAGSFSCRSSHCVCVLCTCSMYVYDYFLSVCLCLYVMYVCMYACVFAHVCMVPCSKSRKAAARIEPEEESFI